MSKKRIFYLFLVVIFLFQPARLSAELNIEQLKETYHYPSAREILYCGESNLDDDGELEKIIAIYDGEFSFLKLLITKKKKIISVIDLDVTPAYSKVLNVNFKDILDLKYNQIIMEVSFPVYGRTLTGKKYLFIVAYENGAYKQIFSHEIELEAIDSFDQWQQHIKYDYSITSGKNAKIIFTNTKNSLIDVNNKKLEPPKIDKTEEYVWDGTEFKRVNWSIYKE